MRGVSSGPNADGDVKALERPCDEFESMLLSLRRVAYCTLEKPNGGCEQPLEQSRRVRPWWYPVGISRQFFWRGDHRRGLGGCSRPGCRRPGLSQVLPPCPCVREGSGRATGEVKGRPATSTAHDLTNTHRATRSPSPEGTAPSTAGNTSKRPYPTSQSEVEQRDAVPAKGKTAVCVVAGSERPRELGPEVWKNRLEKETERARAPLYGPNGWDKKEPRDAQATLDAILKRSTSIYLNPKRAEPTLGTDTVIWNTNCYFQQRVQDEKRSDEVNKRQHKRRSWINCLLS
ncbi:hypothetical protein NDU88_002439 [Pleurodeles waltl]|uniref:Uncharacterized protein n=1 Tax=Pleurodeles waltl TaxID=8319 RepID=A0AAV7UYV9_PLEWA|nr:hypothetical protein NDU88_002439 [Pleurodeles waltl]